MEQNIHSTALVSKSANLGKNVKIGPYTIIEDNVKIIFKVIFFNNKIINFIKFLKINFIKRKNSIKKSFTIN